MNNLLIGANGIRRDVVAEALRNSITAVCS